MNNKILFDLEATQPSQSGKRHGGGIYGEILFRKLGSLKADMVAFYDSGKWLNPDILNFATKNNISLVDIKGRNLEQLIEEHQPDIFYSCLITPEQFIQGTKIIGTVHGLRFLELPPDKLRSRYTDFNWKQRIKLTLQTMFPNKFLKYYRDKRYAHYLDINFIVISNHTAYSVKQFFPEAKNRDLKIFYSPSTTVEMELNSEKAADYPYFLMVSGNRWEKNTLRAIIAFERLFDAGFLEGIKVHITGLKSLKDIKYHYRHPERFIAMGYVDDDELQRQYRDAYGFIYPSLNEGFGYPPIEAMRFGVPTAASGVCSIPEVCGDAVLYFNPMDIAEIANRILQLTDADIRKRLHSAGLERYKLITEKQNNDLQALAEYLMTTK